MSAISVKMICESMFSALETAQQNYGRADTQGLQGELSRLHSVGLCADGVGGMAMKCLF